MVRGKSKKVDTGRMREGLYDENDMAMDRVCYRYFTFVRFSDCYSQRNPFIERRYKNDLVYSLRAISDPTLDFSSLP